MDLLAEGWTAEIYALSDTQVLKLYKPGFEGVCDSEYLKTQYLQTQTPLAPKVQGLRTEAGRKGYVMERIHACSLGRDVNTSVECIARTLTDTQCVVGKIAADRLFSPVHERIEQRLLSGREKLGDMADGALEVLRATQHADHLCHGDFHPGNLLASPQGLRVIDWNGASLGPLESDIAKTLILLLYAPPGLALDEPWYAKRLEIASLYHRILQQSGHLDGQSLGSWLYIRIAEFLILPVPAFHKVLLPQASRWTHTRSVDCQALFVRS